jgi:enamine deaminase RidA (YjgF/YER057c/UK114 family)
MLTQQECHSVTRKTFFSGSKFEDMAGYCRAISDGRWVFVSGTSGHNAKTGQISDDVREQTRESLRTIESALKEANSGLIDIVRMRVFVAERDHVMPVSAVLKEHFEKIRPTNTTIVSVLADASMKVELEVTALRSE